MNTLASITTLTEQRNPRKPRLILGHCIAREHEEGEHGDDAADLTKNSDPSGVVCLRAVYIVVGVNRVHRCGNPRIIDLGCVLTEL